MILGIDHVQITIPAGGLAEARAFYCGLLNFREIEKPVELQGRGGFWLQVGDRQLHIGIEDGVDRQATKAHVAYAVHDIKAWRSTLLDAGVKLSRPSRSLHSP